MSLAERWETTAERRMQALAEVATVSALPAPGQGQERGAIPHS